MPDGMSPERAAIATAFGAQVMTLGDFQVTDALAMAREFGAQPGYFAPQQFDSEWNVEENRTWLGPEVLGQLPAGVLPDAVVGGVGTGGTIVGEEPGPTGVTSEVRPAPSNWVPAPASRPTRVRADPSHCPHISAADDDLARPKRCAPIWRSRMHSSVTSFRSLSSISRMNMPRPHIYPPSEHPPFGMSGRTSSRHRSAT
jgi:Pyridoxal-phosphate dependent enzyme